MGCVWGRQDLATLFPSISLRAISIYNLATYRKKRKKMADIRTSTLSVLVLVLCSSLLVAEARETCYDFTEAVFPFYSRCQNPAVYLSDVGGRYVVSFPAGDAAGSLAPEWDESNSTYYIRISDTPSTYGFTYNTTTDSRSFVGISDTFYITNVDTGRFLAWRDEDGEKFLVETDSDSSDSTIQLFRFDISSLNLPCPLIYPPVSCYAYNIRNADSSTDGLGPYLEDGVTYFKLQSDTSSFVLTSSTSATGLKMSTD